MPLPGKRVNEIIIIVHVIGVMIGHYGIRHSILRGGFLEKNGVR